VATHDKHGPHVHIGWCEYVDIPAWGIFGLRAKADTGARSSSLHVENLIELPRGRVGFDVVLHRTKRDRRVHVEAPVSRLSRVRSSLGVSATRPFVRATVHIGPVEEEIELNLVDRGHLLYRMLLGRTALSGLLVDVNRRYALGKRRRATTRRSPRDKRKS
jgi:hypothetical protein